MWEAEAQTKWVTPNHTVQDMVGRTFAVGLPDHKVCGLKLQHGKIAPSGEVSSCGGSLNVVSQDHSSSHAFALYNTSSYLRQDFFGSRCSPLEFSWE